MGIAIDRHGDFGERISSLHLVKGRGRGGILRYPAGVRSENAGSICAEDRAIWHSGDRRGVAVDQFPQCRVHGERAPSTRAAGIHGLYAQR